MNAPRYGTALSLDEAREAAHAIGYPVLVRPSYVLGGRGMEMSTTTPNCASTSIAH